MPKSSKSWLRSLLSQLGFRGKRKQPVRFRQRGNSLCVEQLEDRLVPSAVRPNLFNSNSLGRIDDNPSAAVSLGFTIDFFGPDYNQLYVNNNGNVTFGSPDGSYVPTALTTAGQIPRMAPFFADVDTRNQLSGVVTYGTGIVNGRNAFGVNWPDVGYYSAQGSPLNKFQLVIIDRSDTGPGNFDLEFNYDKILWQYGSASNNVSAAAGFTNGTGAAGTFYEISGSRVTGAFLDNNLTTGLIHNSLNSTEDGRYVFFGRAGVIIPANQPPTAEANGVYSVAEGGTVALSSVGSTDPDGTIATYQWDFNYNGTTFDIDATGASPTFSATGLDGPSSRTIALRVTDDDGSQSVDTATVNITNAPPSGVQSRCSLKSLRFWRRS